VFARNKGQKGANDIRGNAQKFSSVVLRFVG